MTPEFDWTVYLKAKGESGLATLNVTTPDFFKTFNEQIATADIDALKSYMRWHTVHQFAPNLSEPFVTGKLQLLRSDTGRPEGACSALETLHHGD